MPLKQSSSPKAFKSNLKAERNAGKSMKQSLAIAYSVKRKNKKQKGYAEGGAVDALKPMKASQPNENEELDMTGSPAEMPSHQVMSSAADSDMQEDLPKLSEALDLASQVMEDRQRRKMMSQGGVAEYQSKPSHMSEDVPAHDEDGIGEGELDAPREDGRDTRGLNLEPVHDMEDDEHDVGDASLVGQILSERKARRRNR